MPKIKFYEILNYLYRLCLDRIYKIALDLNAILEIHYPIVYRITREKIILLRSLLARSERLWLDIIRALKLFWKHLKLLERSCRNVLIFILQLAVKVISGLSLNLVSAIRAEAFRIAKSAVKTAYGYRDIAIEISLMTKVLRKIIREYSIQSLSYIKKLRNLQYKQIYAECLQFLSQFVKIDFVRSLPARIPSLTKEFLSIVMKKLNELSSLVVMISKRIYRIGVLLIHSQAIFLSLLPWLLCSVSCFYVVTYFRSPTVSEASSNLNTNNNSSSSNNTTTSISISRTTSNIANGKTLRKILPYSKVILQEANTSVKSVQVHRFLANRQLRNNIEEYVALEKVANMMPRAKKKGFIQLLEKLFIFQTPIDLPTNVTMQEKCKIFAEDAKKVNWVLLKMIERLFKAKHFRKHPIREIYDIYDLLKAPESFCHWPEQVKIKIKYLQQSYDPEREKNGFCRISAGVYEIGAPLFKGLIDNLMRYYNTADALDDSDITSRFNVILSSYRDLVDQYQGRYQVALPLLEIEAEENSDLTNQITNLLNPKEDQKFSKEIFSEDGMLMVAYILSAYCQYRLVLADDIVNMLAKNHCLLRKRINQWVLGSKQCRELKCIFGEQIDSYRKLIGQTLFSILSKRESLLYQQTINPQSDKIQKWTLDYSGLSSGLWCSVRSDGIVLRFKEDYSSIAQQSLSKSLSEYYDVDPDLWKQIEPLFWVMKIAELCTICCKAKKLDPESTQILKRAHYSLARVTDDLSSLPEDIVQLINGIANIYDEIIAMAISLMQVAESYNKILTIIVDLMNHEELASSIADYLVTKNLISNSNGEPSSEAKKYFEEMLMRLKSLIDSTDIASVAKNVFLNKITTRLPTMSNCSEDMFRIFREIRLMKSAVDERLHIMLTDPGILGMREDGVEGTKENMSKLIHSMYHQLNEIRIEDILWEDDITKTLISPCLDLKSRVADTVIEYCGDQIFDDSYQARIILVEDIDMLLDNNYQTTMTSFEDSEHIGLGDLFGSSDQYDEPTS